MRARREEPLWAAAMVQRISGLLLAAFLPVHFLVMALAIEDGARLDRFLAWTDAAPVKVAEAVLVALLAAHLLGGLRVMALEALPWRDWQARAAAAIGAASVLVAAGFLASALA